MEDFGILTGQARNVKGGFIMRIYRLIVLIALLTFVSGCYLGITGKVIDAETNQPIEGAVVLVEWTKTKGYPGMSHTESAKVAETLSDKDGKFDLPGCYDPFANAPDLAIYKKGYVTWSNRWIFPSWKNRVDFQWGSSSTYQMERFKDAYSYIDHQGFTTAAINSTIGWDEKKIFLKKYDDGERDRVIQERSRRDAERKRGMNK